MRIVNHYQCGIKLPITQFNGSPYDYRSIEFLDSAVRLKGYAGGPYAAFSVNIDIDENQIQIYDTKHNLNYTNHFNHHLILDFVKFFKDNIDVNFYLHQPTNTGMVMLSDEDTNKLRSWAESHKFEESTIKENRNKLFEAILDESRSK